MVYAMLMHQPAWNWEFLNEIGAETDSKTTNRSDWGNAHTINCSRYSGLDKETLLAGEQPVLKQEFVREMQEIRDEILLNEGLTPETIAKIREMEESWVKTLITDENTPSATKIAGKPGTSIKETIDIVFVGCGLATMTAINHLTELKFKHGLPIKFHIIGGTVGGSLRTSIHPAHAERGSGIYSQFLANIQLLEKHASIEVNAGENLTEQQFKQLEQDNPNFSYNVALSEPLPEDKWEGMKGFIHQCLLDNYLNKHEDPTEIEYYLCGPPMMLKCVQEMLDSLGVEREMIDFDDFG